MNKYLISVLLFITFESAIFAKTSELKDHDISRWNISLQYIGLTYHPNGGNTPQIYPLKFDKKAYWVLEAGGAISLDYEINNDFFLRKSIALYKDCAFVTAGYFHFGPRGKIYETGKHSFNGGLGPTLLFRDDWHKFPEYTGDTFYNKKTYKNWQYRFIFYGGEFEYLYKLKNNLEFQYSIIPGFPFVLTSKFGIRFKF